MDDFSESFRLTFHLLSSLEPELVDIVGLSLWDGRFSLATTVLAAFGRAIAEVGAVIIFGGNISGVTRIMSVHNLAARRYA